MIRLFIYIIGVVSVLAFSSCSHKKTNENVKEKVDTIPMLVTQIQKCSKLYTAEFKVHKIITHDDQIRAKGKFLQHDFDVALPVGTRKIAIPVDATIKAYIDLGEITARNIKKNGKRIEIILPEPRIQLTASKINHGEIKKYVALMRQDFSDAELANYEQQGREAIISDIPKMNITDMARESAAKIIVPFLAALGYDGKDITITFSRDFTAADVMKMLDPTTVVEGK